MSLLFLKLIDSKYVLFLNSLDGKLLIWLSSMCIHFSFGLFKNVSLWIVVDLLCSKWIELRSYIPSNLHRMHHEESIPIYCYTKITIQRFCCSKSIDFSGRFLVKVSKWINFNLLLLRSILWTFFSSKKQSDGISSIRLSLKLSCSNISKFFRTARSIDTICILLA